MVNLHLLNLRLIISHLVNLDLVKRCLGLGIVPGEKSFFYENEQKLSRTIPKFRKKELTHRMIERVLKNIGTIITNVERMKLLEKNVKIKSACLLSGTCYKSRTHFKSGTCKVFRMVKGSMFAKLYNKIGRKGEWRGRGVKQCRYINILLQIYSFK